LNQDVGPVEHTSKLIDAFGTTEVFIVTSLSEASQAVDLGQRLWAMLGAV
jgi:hypothetical protein